jgi:hypothetical protein
MTAVSPPNHCNAGLQPYSSIFQKFAEYGFVISNNYMDYFNGLIYILKYETNRFQFGLPFLPERFATHGAGLSRLRHQG